MRTHLHQRPLGAFIGLCTVVLVVAVLNLAQEFIMPLALSALLAFMLSPLVRRLCKIGFPRALSVVVVTVLSFSFLGVLIWLLGQQAANLANELPNYSDNIKKRVESVQQLGQNPLIEKMRRFGNEIGTPAQPGAPAQPNATADQIQSSSQGLASKFLNTILNGLAGALGTAAVVILYVIFMLLRQDDISQRIVRLAGFSRLTTTTRALDEVGERVSQYLLMQGIVNGIYGLAMAIALSIVGLPYVVLWGVLAAIFRYIPYVGPIIVAVLPISFSLAYFDGWTQPLIVVGVILVLELITNMILEPILYGKSTGVSDFSLIIAITFWTWLWGSIGLILATPMTVCLVVLCKYIPKLDWVDTIMGDNAKPSPHLNYYQQLISGEVELAHDSAEESLHKAGLFPTVQNIILPALSLTRRETLLGNLDNEDQAEVHDQIKTTLGLLREYKDKKEDVESDKSVKSEREQEEVSSVKEEKIAIFARALHGDADSLALQLLELCLPQTIRLDISSEPHLIGELIHALEEKKPDLVCISAMPPEAETTAMTLCRRIRSRLPNLKILVCAWSLPGQEPDTRVLREAGASAVARNMEEATTMIARFTGEEDELLKLSLEAKQADQSNRQPQDASALSSHKQDTNTKGV